jgi:hypothetical protein
MIAGLSHFGEHVLHGSHGAHFTNSLLVGLMRDKLAGIAATVDLGYCLRGKTS